MDEGRGHIRKQHLNSRGTKVRVRVKREEGKRETGEGGVIQRKRNREEGWQRAVRIQENSMRWVWQGKVENIKSNSEEKCRA